MIGKRLILLRGSRTQQEIADALGISRARYSHYENGRNEPDLATLNHMAEFFQVTADYLLGRNEAYVKEEKTDYERRFIKDIQELSELFQIDPDSYRFWIEYRKATEENRKYFLQLWKVMMELERKKNSSKGI